MQRAIGELCQLTDQRLFEEVETGVGLVVEVVGKLDAAAQKLSEVDDHHPACVLRNLAEEEAAKVLILLHAVRCPRRKQKEGARVLGYLYDHLAKGIYAKVCKWRPADFAEVAGLIEAERVEHYLDGPIGFEWIFPNQITQRREDDLYVGYVRDDSEEEGQDERYWTQPMEDAGFGLRTREAVKLASALHQVAAIARDSLAVVAEIWRPIQIHPEMSSGELQQLSRRTLDELEGRGWLSEAPGEVYATIVQRWPFPLWPLDLRMKRVEKEQLRALRRQWTPGSW